MRKGQISVEMLLVIGFGFLLLTFSLIILSYVTTTATDASITAEVTEIGEAMINNAKAVALLGTGTRSVLTVTFPENVVSMEIESDHTLVITISTHNGMKELIFYSDYPMTTSTGVVFPAVDFSLGEKRFAFSLQGDTVFIERI